MDRFFDILFSGIALLLLSPFLVPILITLRLTGEGEVFFLQERIGKEGKLFKLKPMNNEQNIGFNYSYLFFNNNINNIR